MRRLLLVAVFAAALALPGGAGAATFAVNTVFDAPDATPGDGLCATLAGACSLRAAVMEANALGGPDSVVLPFATYSLNVGGPDDDTAATGDLDITDTLALSGPGAIGSTVIDGNAADRVFDVIGATVQISGITIQNGSRAGGTGSGDGGGIRNTGVLTLTRVEVVGSAAVTGGGIWNSGTLHLVESSVRANTAVNGGGIANATSASLDVQRTTIAGNIASGDSLSAGGGVQAAGQVALAQTTVSGNRADYAGGGVWVAGQATLTNVTVSGNRAGANGGGIRVDGRLTLAYSTVAGNTLVTLSTDQGGGVHNGSGLASVTLQATILSSNQPVNCGFTTGQHVSGGFNLDSGVSCLLDPAHGDLAGRDPALGPLAANGGEVETQALPSGSPAVDAAAGTGCPAIDARGIARPQGPACDIGAFELVGGGPTGGGSGTGVTVIVGTSGDDVLRGTPGRDIIRGLGGNDRIVGLGGNDVLVGGPGDDVIDGGPGEDSLRGGTGDDRLTGGPGFDRLRGEAGDDILDGGPGDDDLYGGGGADTLLAAGGGSDLVDGGGGNDTAKADETDIVRQVEHRR